MLEWEVFLFFLFFAMRSSGFLVMTLRDPPGYSGVILGLGSSSIQVQCSNCICPTTFNNLYIGASFQGPN